MMALPLLITAIWAVPRRFAVRAFAPTTSQGRTSRRCCLFSTDTNVPLENCLSRLSTLQTLLNKHGAPGSEACRVPNDLQPVVSLQQQEIPELLSALTGSAEAPTIGGGNNDCADRNVDLSNLHPYLFPISQSKASPETMICAYRNPATEESDRNYPWPIVEAKVGGPGFRLLALNSEHMMRRIACESDDNSLGGETSEIVSLYNRDLGKNMIADAALDSPYQVGAVARLGYGVDKYVLLRVGPFPDLYEAMSRQHQDRGDEQSSLIAAEASNKKLAGFASTFLHYARLLASFPNRREESRDAARMCLRLPLSSIGTSYDAFKDAAVLGEIAEETDATDIVLEKLSEFCAKMREVEQEEDNQQGKTPQQAVFEEAGLILDEAALAKTPWSSARDTIGEKLRSVGRNNFAQFIDYKPL